MEITRFNFSKSLEANQLNYWEEEYDWEKIDPKKMIDHLEKWMATEFFERRFNYAAAYYPLEGKVLDFGAGSLWCTALMSKLPKITEVHAVEVSENRLRYEGIPFFKHLKGDESKVKLYAGDAHKLDFPDGYFDIAICDGVLHHLDNMKYGLQEMNRVIKPGGHLVVLREPTLADWRSPMSQIPTSDFDMQIMNIEYWRYSKQYQYEIALNGFEIVKRSCYGNSHVKKLKGIPVPGFMFNPPFATLYNKIVGGGEDLIVARKNRNMVEGTPKHFEL